MIKPHSIVFAALLAAGAAYVASQWGHWGTGRQDLVPMALITGGPEISPPGRIWIDTDAACGATARTDPDDCLAILWLLSHGADIAGLTSFGNANGDIVADRVAALVAQMALDGMSVPPVFRGHGAPLGTGAAAPPGVIALQAALEAGPLTILALGPLSNVASALEGRPDLQRNVTRIVAVMGHRAGHLFHPTEGKGTGALFGHGPIFRDLNVSVDSAATRAVLAMRLPMTLIPYDAARATMITAADLDSLARQSPSHAWVAYTARDWLAFWNDDVGLAGFYPFDWIAAAYITDPARFKCAEVTARMAWEWTFWLVPHDSLVVEMPATARDNREGSVALYCPETSALLHDVLIVR
ncbi:nucleoside hydrolase [Cypionkella sp. TWP1-2-1b2]|uniref:nucleoside hydrolase n=1 Tax=Cypionkella sp. TWP1-2-1b2 TaxID=2804675 RepID=UPI003CF36442